jgi:thiosulfate/3-mercaptopyruvate sulfurtransferase
VTPWPARYVAVDDVPVTLVDDDGRPITVLDARKRGAFAARHLPGAARVDWMDLRDGRLRTGRVDDDERRLAKKLARLGVDDDHRVLVVGARPSWGEDARVAWTLLYLGHRAVAVLDGGVDAWTRAGRPLVVDGRWFARRPARGTFTPRVDPAWRAVKDDVVAAVRAGGAQIVDARSRAEYDGATPYWEARGGRLPGAIHLPHDALFDAAGRVRADVVAVARAAGVDPARPVLAYCTGGVRSAAVALALRERGVDARNYDGSFWEWSADRALPLG